VHVFVARRAGRGRPAITVGVALTARDGLVSPRQREFRLGVIEQHGRKFRGANGMAIRADRELPLMDIAMTARALGREVLIDARRQRSAMALFTTQRGVLSTEEFRKPRMVIAGDSE